MPDAEEVKAIIRLFNSAELTAAIPIRGYSTPVLIDRLMDEVDLVCDQGKEDDIPQKVIAFYTD